MLQQRSLLQGHASVVQWSPLVEEFALQGPSKLDLLFVVDNSGTMGSKQSQLASGVSAMVDALRAPEVDASVRVAVTTSDMGGPSVVPGCEQGDDGALIYSSCLDRPLDFDNFRKTYSRFNTACTSACSLDSEALKTSRGSNGRSANWLAFGNGQSNLVNQALEVDAALACVLPQGIGGCGFESQLDAMRAALHRASTKDGFLRDEANLAVIHVTDELDCSTNSDHPDYDGIFDETVFGRYAADFMVPGQRSPSSASCLMAGAQCEKGKRGYFESCKAVNWDLDRSLVKKEPLLKSVLRPVSVYQAQLEEIRRKKQATNPNATVFVGLLGGVEPNSKAIRYRHAEDGTSGERSNFTNFGIGFGCEGLGHFVQERDPLTGELLPAGQEKSFALPPIRIRALMEGINDPERSGYASVCANDWGAQLADLALEAIKDSGRTCAPGWVADRDPHGARFVPDCQVFEKGPDNTRREISECQRDNQGYVREDSTNRFVPPNGAESCFLALTDSFEQRSSDPYDDMSMRCSWLSNVEFRVVRKTGSSEQSGVAWSARCRMWDGT